MVPVYSGGKTLNRLHSLLEETLGGRYAYEVLYVYDCGRDNSWEVICSLAAAHPGTVKGFRLKKNYGQHNAVLFGLSRASGRFIITLDEDLQHDPAIIHALLGRQQEGGYDVVYAGFSRLRQPGIRVLASDMLRYYIRTRIEGINPGYSSYRLIKREAAGRLAAIRSPYTFLDGSIGRLGMSTVSIKSNHHRRASGKSSYSTARLLRHAFGIAIAHTRLRKKLALASFFFLLAAVTVVIISASGSAAIIRPSLALWPATAGILLLTASMLARHCQRRGMRENIFPEAAETV